MHSLPEAMVLSRQHKSQVDLVWVEEKQKCLQKWLVIQPSGEKKYSEMRRWPLKLRVYRG